MWFFVSRTPIEFRKSGKALNHELGQFINLVYYLCLGGCVARLWSAAQEVASLNSHFSWFFVTEFNELGETQVSSLQHRLIVYMSFPSFYFAHRKCIRLWFHLFAISVQDLCGPNIIKYWHHTQGVRKTELLNKCSPRSNATIVSLKLILTNQLYLFTFSACHFRPISLMYWRLSLAGQYWRFFLSSGAFRSLQIHV